ncbi:isoleucine--tRNA ligase [Bacteroides heparinolyticus]|uniref:isoleucine--tRNA ligase n=1 Tax=Prevotella heparinolytica TaxID=28113 RepID=UPI0035A1567F
MAKKFAEYSQFDLSEVNKEVLKKWDENGVFAKSMTEREGCPSFVFYEGPPSANGMPGIHHVMARSIKDIFCRYKTMKGFLVKRKAGWDTHGLPVELGVEKALGITKEDIGKSISVAEYNKACRKDVMKFTKEWEDLTHKMGYWVDMKDPYITYDNRYIETLWWLLKQLYKKGLLYKGYTIQPYSPAAGTGLSSHELNQPGCYRDVKDTTVVGQFKIKQPKPEMAEWGTPYFLAWTTTPWTLPSNTALCVGPKIEYVSVQTYNGYTGEKITVVLAKPLLYTHFNKKAEDIALEDYKPGDKLIPFKVVGEYKGTDLVGMEYEQLIPWVKPVDVDNDGNWKASANGFRVIPGDYVTTEDGTGIVHIAPTFGADDAFVARAAGIPSLFMINKRGETRPMVDLTGKFYLLDELDERFIAECVNIDLYKEYEGRWVKNAYDPQFTIDGKYDEKAAGTAESLDIYICMMMKAANQAFKIEKHVHNYPHCWRTDKPVLYYPLDSWFIRSTACKERMMELNKTINWKPESTGTGRFGKWLENLNDWNLSRSRYWGTPLPIWRTEDGSDEKCIESVEELYNEIEKSVAAGLMTSNPYKEMNFKPGLYTEENYDKIDLHRPYVDDIVLVSKDGLPMKRESDLIDVWFDSGAMPYAQIHYPFENKELLDSHQVYPADFIAEGVDQTRGWFFTLHAIATMVFDSVSYKAVISNGLVLDKNGNKMSKRLGNAIDPFSTIEKYGSDPLRWYMITNSSPWDNLKFDVEGIEEVRRKFFGTLYNTYSFFALYANVDGFEYKEADVQDERPEIDRWILSVLNTLVRNVDTCYNEYEPTKAGRLISEFVNDNLSNWYVRLNRKRFWGGGMTQDKLSAFQTLYTCLETVAKLMAPIAPFYADKLYMDLIAATGRDKVVSVHLSKFPECKEELIDKELEDRMQMAQDVTSMVLALRRKVNIKVRQPLQCIMIPVTDDKQRAHIEAVKALVMNEVNVKEIKFVDGTAGILVKKVKCDFKKLGPKFGKQMKAVAAAVAELSQEAIAQLENNGSYTLKLNGEEAVIETTDVEIFSEDIPGWLVANEGKLTVALEVTVTEELRREGIARELVNRIQNIRKSSGFEITDKINITLSKNPQTDDAVNEYKDYICNQVLGTSLMLIDEVENGTELNFDDFSLYASIVKE